MLSPDCSRITTSPSRSSRLGPIVGAGTSKANTAILHTGFDATPGSVESRLVARGYALLRAYAPTVGISIEETGALLVAWDDEQAASLPSLAAKAAANGYDHAEVVDAAAVYDMRATPRRRGDRRDAGSRRAHHRPVVALPSRSPTRRSPTALRSC